MSATGKYGKWRRAGGPAGTALLLAVLLVSASGCAGVRRTPLLAVDPLPDVAELECRTETLPRWGTRGFTGATLLLFGVNPGLHPLGEARSAELAEVRRSGGTGSPDLVGLETAGDSCSMEAGFVRAAAGLGVVREVVWVTPFDSFHSPDPVESLRADLKHAGIADDDARAFVLQSGCFRGTAGGVPLAVCGIGSLPPVPGPLLLVIDAEYILAAAAAAAAKPATNPVAEIRLLLSALAARRYAVADAVLSASVAEGRVPPVVRWVGETVAQALHDPKLLAGSEQARRWDKLQGLAVLLGKRQYTEVFHQVWQLLVIHGEDPALHLFAAEAQVGLGKLEEALESAEEACRLHRGYCYGLLEIGSKLFAAGDIDGGERFFASGLRLRPGMTYAQFDRGLLLLASGRPEQALAVFQGLSDGGRAFPGGFLAGALLLESGDRPGAARHFDRALAALRFEPDAAADHSATFEAIGAAIRFYREEGLFGNAELLEANPRLVSPGGNLPEPPAGR